MAFSKTARRGNRKGSIVQSSVGQWVQSLEGRTLLSSAQLLVDVNDATPDSAPGQFVSFEGSEFFIATVGTTAEPQQALAKSDGTQSGTVIVKALGVQTVSGLQVDNGIMSFASPSGNINPTQWVSDGTAAGTHTVAALPASASPYDQHDFHSFGGFTLFAGNDGTADGLWRTNTGGTPSQVKAISVKSSFVPLGGVLYFTADDGVHGAELWTTDGTDAGTSMVADLNPGSGSAQIAGMAAVNGQLYFTANPANAGRPGLWNSDGTSAGTQLVVSNVVDGVGVGGLYYYSDPWALWRTDGTPGGTFTIGQANNLGGGVGYNPAENLMAFNNLLVFVGYQPTTGMELWRSDGTDAGTYLLKDINPGTNNYWPDYDYTKRSTPEFTAIGSTLYFNADDGPTGLELWKTDGTSAGTSQLKDINPGGVYSSPSQLTNVGGKLFFSADDGVHGLEPWLSDGTPAGTVMAADLNGVTVASNPDNLLSLGGRMLFTATDDAGYSSLYASDGTAVGTSAIVKLGVASAISFPAFQTDGSVAYFIDTNYEGSPTLFKTDGTPAGTHSCVGDFALNDGYQSLAVVNGKCFFVATDSEHNYQLWVTDGTLSSMLTDIHPAAISGITAASSNVYFVADDTVHGNELWITDGTVTGTRLVKDIDPGPNGTGFGGFANYNGKIYFNASDGVHGSELWVSDGTDSGTKMVADIYPGPDGSGPHDLTVSGGLLYFSAKTVIGKSEQGQLFKTDGTTAGTAIVKLIGSPGGSNPADLLDVNGTLYFDVTAFPHSGIWKTDGTDAGTKEIYPAIADNLPDNIYRAAAANGRVYFDASAFDSNGTLSRLGLWQTDGTAAGTFLVSGLTPPAVSGIGGNVTIAPNGSNGTLFFAYSDEVHGNEMWVLPPDSPPQEPAGLAITVTGGPATPAAARAMNVSLTPAPVLSKETIVVKWIHGNDMNGYRLQRSTDPAFSHIDASFTVPANYHQYTDTVPVGSNYYYRLVAYNPRGNSPAAIVGTVVLPPPATGSIGGAVFNDANANGKRDTGETAIAGVRIFLDQNSNGVFDPAEASTLTDAAGAFKFTGLAAGTYHVRQVIPAGWKVITPASDVLNPALAKGQALTAQNFADAKRPVTASINGVVFNDANGNAIRESSEKGLAAWKIYLDTNNNGKLDTGERTAVTDSSGNYAFTGLPAGTYHVRDGIQSGWRATGVSSITITLGSANITGKNFAVAQTARVSGTVFLDANHNGVLDKGEKGLAGWRVFIDANNDGVWQSTETSATTAADGTFALTIPAGTRRLRAVTKTGYARTAPSTGLYTLTLSLAQVLSGKNFGYR